MRDGARLIRVDDGALVVGRQETGSERAAAVVWQSSIIGESDEGGHVFRKAAKSVRNPGAGTREAGEEKSGGLQVADRAVDV